MDSDSATVRDQLKRLEALVRERYVPDSPTHDYSHLERVASITARICAVEGGSQLVALSAAWLHDLHREERPRDDRFFVSPEAMDERARRFLYDAGIPQAIHEEILKAVHYTDRFSFSDRPVHEGGIEARAVRDADNLDAIGAIGIARAFSFGGRFGIPLWESDASVNADLYAQSERPASTIHHFHEKLLRLPSELETTTAIQMASQRSAYMTRFVEQFMREWREDFQSDGSVNFDYSPFKE